jgi:hypothetical protein
MKKFIALLIVLVVSICFNPFGHAEEVKKENKDAGTGVIANETEDDRLIRLVSSLIEKEVPDKLESLKPECRRIAFYTLTVDKGKVNPMLLHIVRGIIESQFTKFRRATLVEIPNLKPIKLITKDNNLVFTSGISSLEEMKKIAEDNKLDGFLEGVINITEQQIYISMRIVANDGGIIWSEYMTTTGLKPPEPPAKPSVFKSEIDLGLSWLKLEKGSEGATTDVKSVPSHATYYMPELRIYEKGWIGGGLSFGLGIGCMVNGTGVDVGESSLVSPNGFGFGGVYLRGYLRTSFIPKADPDMGDWFAAEFNGASVFASKPTGLNFFGVSLISDISSHFSISAGAYYATPIEQLLSNTTVKIGGVFFDVFVIRYFFNR